MAEVMVDFRSVHRAWKAEGHGDFWVEVATETGTEEALIYALEQVCEPDGILGEFPSRSPSGFVAQVSGADYPDHLDTWLGRLAGEMGAVGFTGRIAGVRPVRSPSWMRDERWLPTAFFAWVPDPAGLAGPQRGTDRWHVPEPVTRQICDLHARWVTSGGPDAVARRRVFPFALTDTTALGPILASAVTDTGMAGAYCFDRRARSARRVTLDTGGLTCAQIIDASRERWERALILRDLMAALPAPLTQAFVRSGSAGISWMGFDYHNPLPHVHEGDVRYNKHLLDRYVPDAHAIQVLTDAHLANAHDLSGWHLTDLGAGRHLVEAPDLTPWFRDPLPDPDTAEQARHDFGTMILTPETIHANPPTPRTPAE